MWIKSYIFLAQLKDAGHQGDKNRIYVEHHNGNPFVVKNAEGIFIEPRALSKRQDRLVKIQASVQDKIIELLEDNTAHKIATIFSERLGGSVPSWRVYIGKEVFSPINISTYTYKLPRKLYLTYRNIDKIIKILKD